MHSSVATPDRLPSPPPNVHGTRETTRQGHAGGTGRSTRLIRRADSNVVLHPSDSTRPARVHYSRRCPIGMTVVGVPLAIIGLGLLAKDEGVGITLAILGGVTALVGSGGWCVESRARRKAAASAPGDEEQAVRAGSSEAIRLEEPAAVAQRSAEDEITEDPRAGAGDSSSRTDKRKE